MKFLKTFLISFLFVCKAISQQAAPPFYEDIQAFKKLDSANFPAPDQILFVGSSSFTKWKDVQDYFPGYPIINRGFGGSSLPDVIRYADDIIFPYHPKQIVIYCGENDLASSDTVSSIIVFTRFEQLFNLIRQRLPDVPIIFISLKPSPSRQSLMPKMSKANMLIQEYLKDKPKAIFLDVYHKMLDNTGQPLKDIYIEDHLHMNAKGYAIWQKIIQPYLLKD